MTEEHKRCGDCARFKVPDSGCTYAKDIRDGIIRADDRACDDFYPAHGKKKEKPASHKASGISDLGPFEAIYHGDKPAFLVKNGENFQIVESVTNQGKTVLPKEAHEIPYEPYGYYEHTIPNREDLFWKVRDEFDLFLDCESIYKDFLAACVLLSYQQEKVRTVPYVYFYGDNESGKTVALTLLSKLCYRPMFGVTIPYADLYGYLDDVDSPGTILEDEIQGFWKDLDKSKIYKTGYKEGATVPRYFVLPYGRFIRYYRCFCFKACAAEEMPRVKGLAERFVFIPMTEGSPKKDWADIHQEDLNRMRQLRNILLKWRLATRLDWTLADVELQVKGRLKELWKPIIQIASGLTVEHSLRQFLERLEKERMDAKTNTIEGHLVKVVAELYRPSEPTLSNDIWLTLASDVEGRIDEKKPNQMDTPEFGIITKQKIGYRIREVLNGKGKVIRLQDGLQRAYEFNDEKIKRIFKKYGVQHVTKLQSFPTSKSVSTPQTMEKDHENNVEKPSEKPLEVDKSRNIVTNIKAVVALDPTHIGPCMFCGKRVTLTWQVQYFSGEFADVCLDCGTPLLEKVKAQSD